ncbi:2-oxoacid:ferredoxin oxidoreductase subunit beta [Streptomyces albipurpureus]|uniref:2-oxoacid:ferredoxin oxidoreductase subunit beta n=1 Tax=Streptomyces albipurpureus TaxID=2897419 RepID=A0ABT0UJY5_9ACTN|nr:2-oxoacid:ferredoxin oxidoreductase subunit beta [Streptomyces sp. CWNU-1]MCM2388562.1 2-oxoacid:ferredoxin oxidoreductase subunit beta [Streptomyces sp. CWNU-1]
MSESLLSPPLTGPGPRRVPLPLITNPSEGPVKQSAKDFRSAEEVRWCPGCGDYAILAAVQGFLPELGLRRENIVFVSGIGCSSRFPYYMNTYGMHSIHGRAPAIATGLSVSRPDLSVWVITGDGDALSIGGNHLIHALRRNVNLKILLFNNRIYGLTKGQYSPTSEPGKITKSTPMGSLDTPFNPVSLAVGAGAGFVARTVDSDRKHLTSVLRAAAEYEGTALVEIYQNCNIFNDGAFEVLKNPATRDDHLLRLEQGQPLRYGSDGEHTIVRDAAGSLRPAAEAGATEGSDAEVIHDAHAADPALAFALSRLPENGGPTPIGVFRSVARPSYDRQVAEQLEQAVQASGPGDLDALLAGRDHWTV